MFSRIKEDIHSIQERDPAAGSFMEIYLTYPSVKALKSYRKSHWFWNHNMHFIAQWISKRARKRTGIEIHPAATIGRKLFIDHGMGVVIGETAEIGDNCTIYQGVTLGGTGKDRGKRHPTIGSNVMIGAGAKVLGPFTVGDNVKIAANSVVLHPVPDNCTAVGAPAKVVIRNGVKLANNLDQIHIPDPVSDELCKLQDEFDNLCGRLNCIKRAKAQSTSTAKETPEISPAQESDSTK